MPRKITSILPFAFLLLLACSSTPAEVGSSTNSSYYPPDYPVCSIDESLAAGPFEIIRHHTSGTGFGLTISYRGFLADHNSSEEIWFYVELNGQQAWVQGESGTNGDAYAHLWAGPSDCWHCSGYSGQDCTDGVRWVCEWPSELETNLFAWASNGGTLNRWNVQVAASANGAWDSNFGANFGVSFEQRMICAP